jgi:hypothetical protein
MRGVRIGLIGGGLRRDLLVAAVAADARRHLGRIGRRGELKARKKFRHSHLENRFSSFPACEHSDGAVSLIIVPDESEL